MAEKITQQEMESLKGEAEQTQKLEQSDEEGLLREEELADTIFERIDEVLPFEYDNVSKTIIKKPTTQTYTSDVVDDNTITTAKLVDSSVTNSKMADDAIKQAELDTEVASVTVSAGNATGTATVTTGSIILGHYQDGNQDQFIDSIGVSGTTLTVTLAANATADNKFKVVLLKL